ncbi:surfeit locus protein 2 [Hypomesus transpacificus]|uniref:surfeit locus protein 2 n=1 Tax=Hypomesus transpacificus TaxID=137520 RepID=UPI001F085377|nr:surfeit locus protein 2 [Hypomesus transpacificus]
MDELPADLKAFLLNHPFLQLTDCKKIKCSLNGHEFPCSLTELQNFTKGKKYEKLSATAEFNYSQYEPHVVPSTKQANQLFCKLTLRHINRLPHHVLRHVNGKRFKRSLEKYEECVQQGVEFVPVCLQKKRPRDSGGERARGRHGQRGSAPWEPSTSDDGGSDSEDSMSDLYPSSMFSAEETIKDQEEQTKEDDFQTDEEEMEVDKQAPQKRRKVQACRFQKKFKNHKERKGANNGAKITNGK